MPTDEKEASRLAEALADEYVARDRLIEVLKKHGVDVTLRTFDRWHQARNGPARIRVGRQIVYRLSDLRAWLEKHREGGRQPAPRGPQRAPRKIIARSQKRAAAIGV